LFGLLLPIVKDLKGYINLSLLRGLGALFKFLQLFFEYLGLTDEVEV
jgi:hypothetical protein